MQADSVETYIKLKEEHVQASRALQAFEYSRYELVPGVENLSYEQRFDRLFESVVSYAEETETGQSAFGKNAWRKCHAPMRIVTSSSGDNYGLVFNIEILRLGFRSQEKKEIRAGWFDLEKKHSDSVFGPSEVVEFPVIDIGKLADVEWAFQAYISGTPRE